MVHFFDAEECVLFFFLSITIYVYTFTDMFVQEMQSFLVLYECLDSGQDIRIVGLYNMDKTSRLLIIFLNVLIEIWS